MDEASKRSAASPLYPSLPTIPTSTEQRLTALERELVLFKELAEARIALLERTSAATEARRATGVQRIIRRRASALWGRRPAFKKNNRGTAKNIHKFVMRDILNLEKIPNQWKLSGEPTPASIEKEINRITKHLERWTNAGCPTE